MSGKNAKRHQVSEPDFSQFLEMADNELSLEDRSTVHYRKLIESYSAFDAIREKTSAKGWLAASQIETRAKEYLQQEPFKKDWVTAVLSPVQAFLESTLEEPPKTIHMLLLQPLDRNGLDYLKAWIRANPDYQIHLWQDQRVSLAALMRKYIIEWALADVANARDIEPFSGQLISRIIDAQRRAVSHVLNSYDKGASIDRAVQDFLVSYTHVSAKELAVERE
uniref:TcdA/TcdB catalytic glycosyltransferase domain-containing protein n=1 Tax=Endozoicomonas sp. SESOKO2 TaxID=2828743 RepID=UPI0021484B25